MSGTKYYVNSAHIWAKVEIGSEMRKIKMKMNFKLFISLSLTALDLVAQFMLLAGWAKKRCLILVPFRESLLLEVVCANIFVEIKHFWLPRPKVIHVFELMPAEYTFCLKIILYFLFHSLSLLCHQKCLRNHKRIFMDANKYLPSLASEVMVSKIKDLLPGIILPAPGGKHF